MTKKNFENGRSMVEMLGVLAVIGVLSVAGIAGYNTAMQSYRTNEILNATSMFYVLAMAQNAGNGPSGTTPVNYASVGGTDPSGATLAYNPTDKKITITFNEAKDCTSAKNKLGDKASGECPSLIVSFEKENNDSGATTCTQTSCPNGQVCVNGSCEVKATCTDGLWYYPNQNICAADIECDTANSSYERDLANNQCILTCNEGYVFKQGEDGNLECIDINTTCQSSVYASSHPCECDTTYLTEHSCECAGGYHVTGLAGCFTDEMSFCNASENAICDETTRTVICINGTSPVDNQTNGEYPEYSCE